MSGVPPLVLIAGPEQVLADRALAQTVAALRDGAFLLAVPYVRRTTTQRRVNISLDTGTLDAIDQAAKDMRLTRSAFIALATANEIRGAH